MSYRPQGEPIGQDRWAWIKRLYRLKWLKRVLTLLVVGLSFYYLWQRIPATVSQLDWQALHPRPEYLLLSLVITTGCVLLGGLDWHLVLGALGYSLPLRTCLHIQTTSNLAKYLPGYGWQLLGKAYLTGREHVPGQVSALAIGLEFGGLLVAAAAIALFFAPSDSSLPLLGRVPAAWRLGLGTALLVGLFLLPLLWRTRALRRVWRGPQGELTLHPGKWCAVVAVMLFTWLCFGLAFGCIIRSLQPLPWEVWLLAFYALTLGFIVSLLVLFVPSGIGVRESVMVYALSAALPGGVAVAVAVVSRLLLMLSEVLAAALTWGWRGIMRAHNRSITRKD